MSMMTVGMSFVEITDREMYDKPLYRLQKPIGKSTLKHKIGGWMWQKLQKWGVIEIKFDTFKVYTYTRVDQKAVTEMVREAVTRHMDLDRHEKFAVLLGEKQMCELMCESQFGMGGVTLDGGDWRYTKPTHDKLTRMPKERGRVYGLPIHVVRGLDGVAVVPKALIFENVE